MPSSNASTIVHRCLLGCFKSRSPYSAMGEFLTNNFISRAPKAKMIFAASCSIEASHLADDGLISCGEKPTVIVQRTTISPVSAEACAGD